jgi:hypothetical protein
MFEDLNKRSRLVESLQALVYLVRSNPLTALLYCGAITFALRALLHRSPLTVFALQAYLLTFLVFVDLPFRSEKQNVGKWWLWKAFLSAIPMHLLILAGILYWDENDRHLVTRPLVYFSVVILAGLCEGFVMSVIIDHYRPTEQEGKDERT